MGQIAVVKLIAMGLGALVALGFVAWVGKKAYDGIYLAGYSSGYAKGENKGYAAGYSGGMTNGKAIATAAANEKATAERSRQAQEVEKATREAEARADGLELEVMNLRALADRNRDNAAKDPDRATPGLRAGGVRRLNETRRRARSGDPNGGRTTQPAAPAVPP